MAWLLLLQFAILFKSGICSGVEKDLQNLPLEMPALGRTFDIGDLYDARTGKFFASASFWSRDQLSGGNNTGGLLVEDRPYTEMRIETQNTLVDKANSLGVSGSFAVDIANGGISLSGSGSFLQSKVSSANTAKVSLYFKKHTHSVALTMGYLTNASINSPQKSIVWEWAGKGDKARATHVVSKILYGGSVVFDFGLETQDSTSKLKIEGELKVAISTFKFGKSRPKPNNQTNQTEPETTPPPASDNSTEITTTETIPVTTSAPNIEAAAKASYYDEKFSKMKKLHCTFYGDVKPDLNPLTYEDAKQIAIQIPGKISRGTAVPLQVWLLPIRLFRSDTAALVREIQVDLTKQLTTTFENYNKLESYVNNLLVQSVSKAMPIFRRQLLRMKELIDQIRMVLSKELAPLRKLGKVSSGADRYIAMLVETINESKFLGYRGIRKWLKMKEKEAKALSDLFDSNIALATAVGAYEKLLFNPSLEYVAVLKFKFFIDVENEPYLKQLSELLFGISMSDLHSALNVKREVKLNSWTQKEKDLKLGGLYWAIQLFKGIAAPFEKQGKQKVVNVAVTETPAKVDEFNVTLEVNYLGDFVLSQHGTGMIDSLISDEHQVQSRWLSQRYVNWGYFNMILVRTETLFAGLYGLMNEGEKNKKCDADAIPKVAKWQRIYPRKNDTTQCFIKKNDKTWSIEHSDKTKYDYTVTDKEKFPLNPTGWKKSGSPDLIVIMVKVGHCE